MHFGKLLFKINAKFQIISESHFSDISKIPPVALGILLSVFLTLTKTLDLFVFFHQVCKNKHSLVVKMVDVN